MAIGDSIIRVTIIGDAKKLEQAVGRANTATGKLGGNVGKVGGAIVTGLVGLAVVDKAFDFIQGGIDGANQIADAQDRLTQSVGKLDAQKLMDVADKFTELGLSSPEFSTMAADFAGLATSAGIAAPDISSLTDDAVAIAGALALQRNQDPGEFITAIGTAAGGAKKPLKLLNIAVDENEVKTRAMKDTGKDTAGALTDQELATARLEIILDKLKPVLDNATTGTKDLGDKQDILGAKVDTLAAKLGQTLSPALSEVVDFLIDEIDAIPGAIDGWSMLGDAIVGFASKIAAPLGNVRDLIGDILGGIGDVAANVNKGIGVVTGGGGTSERQVNQAVRNFNLRNGQGGL